MTSWGDDGYLGEQRKRAQTTSTAGFTSTSPARRVASRSRASTRSFPHTAPASSGLIMGGTPILDKRSALADYLERIVDPTFEEFAKDRTSIRRAFLACVAISHAIDRVSHPKKPGNLRKKWRGESLAFLSVDIVAHHFKHVESDEERSPPMTGIPLTFALGLSRVDDRIDRNLYFLVRDAVEFLHRQVEYS